MPDNPATHETVLEVVFPGRPHQFVPVTQSPFLIGRGSEPATIYSSRTGASRATAPPWSPRQGGYRLEDRGHRQGIFVNGEKVAQKDACATAT